MYQNLEFVNSLMAALGAHEWVIPKFDWQNICRKPETIENQFVENQPSECIHRNVSKIA